jgi:hypothetical protein
MSRLTADQQKRPLSAGQLATRSGVAVSKSIFTKQKASYVDGAAQETSAGMDAMFCAGWPSLRWLSA